MVRDPLWQKIRVALGGHVDHDLFERCAQDLLGQIYPGLTPVVGGTDAGMDGAIPSAEGCFPLICTTQNDVSGNLQKSINAHLKRRAGPARCILATTVHLTPQRRDNLIDAAKALGAQLHQIHDQEDFVGRL
jgi:hypothetical protein